MSSRLIHPKVGAIFSTIEIISSGFCVLSTIGTASTSPKALNRAAFHSITGNPAKPPIFPNPRTAVPSLTTATDLHFQV